MLAKDIVTAILKNKNNIPQKEVGYGFAPSNIALCKYWGKRNTELNLPTNSSLSISLANLGARTEITLEESLKEPEVILNGKKLALDNKFVKRLAQYLEMFKSKHMNFKITTESTVAVAAGFASSACGYAALVLALNDLFSWDLTKRELSILARLGSGSASRSLWHGFVLWQKGQRDDGMDSHGVAIEENFKDLRIGLLEVDTKEKKLPSREAMEISRKTSPFYKEWPNYCEETVIELQNAIKTRNFKKLGKLTEQCSQAMHALMTSSWPSFSYNKPQTLEFMQQVMDARDNGIDVYFTQDAGPNLKLLFLEKDLVKIKTIFKDIKIIAPFKVDAVELV